MKPEEENKEVPKEEPKEESIVEESKMEEKIESVIDKDKLAEEIKDKAKEIVEKDEGVEEPVEKSIQDIMEENVQEKVKGIKESGEMWVTMLDPAKNFFNSADSAHFFLTQGRAKKLPNKLTPVIEHALSDDNPLLREATEKELIKELRIQEEEYMISVGKLEAPEIKEEELIL